MDALSTAICAPAITESRLASQATRKALMAGGVPQDQHSGSISLTETAANLLVAASSNAGGALSLSGNNITVQDAFVSGVRVRCSTPTIVPVLTDGRCSGVDSS